MLLALILDDGNIYTWGKITSSALGSKYHKPGIPIKLQETKLYTDICAGKDISLALDSSGSVYMWGHWGKNVFKPKKLTGVPKFKQIVTDQEEAFGLSCIIKQQC